jgi:hypothetical protein
MNQTLDVQSLPHPIFIFIFAPSSVSTFLFPSFYPSLFLSLVLVPQSLIFIYPCVLLSPWLLICLAAISVVYTLAYLFFFTAIGKSAFSFTTI